MRLSLLCPKVSNQDRLVFGCQVIYAYKVRYSIEPKEQIYIKKIWILLIHQKLLRIQLRNINKQFSRPNSFMQVKSHFVSKSNIVSMNLNQSNSFCLCSWISLTISVSVLMKTNICAVQTDYKLIIPDFLCYYFCSY